MENEQKQASAPKSNGGCGCRGKNPNLNQVNGAQIPPEMFTDDKQALASLIKAVHERKTKISKTRFRKPL